MNIYLYEMRKAKLKPKIREMAFNLMLECEEPKKLAEVISIFDALIKKEAKVDKLAPIPESQENKPEIK